MTTSRRERSHRATGALTALVATCGSACMPAPGPSAPPRGGLEIGADYRPGALNRWICGTAGSIVLARRGEDLVLHLENLDWVLPGNDAGDFARFGYSTFNGTVDVSIAGVGWTTSKLNEGETVYLASKARGGDLVIKRASASGTTDEKCTWVDT